MLLGGTLLMGCIALAVASFSMYPGSWPVLAAFHVCFLLLIGLVFPRPRLYVYTFFAGFLFLGFWPKVVAHTVWAVAFVEPVGDFTGTAIEWDSALLAATAGAAGIISVRFGYLLLNRGRGRGKSALSENSAVPWWFIKWRKAIWIFTIALVLGLQFLNASLAFFQVGVNPIVIFPMHMNVPIAWLINIGFAIWIATLVHWDFKLNEGTLAQNLIAPIVEAFLTSVSSLSRLAFLLHAGPYLLTLAERWNDFRNALGGGKIRRLSFAFVTLFCVGILTVFLFRVLYFHDYEKYVLKPDETTSSTLTAMTFPRYLREVLVRQIPTLFIQRWIGLEGVLTASKAANRGNDLLLAVLIEDPRKGGKSLYQQHAKPDYLTSTPDKFTFLTNAGVIAILLFSGSTFVVAIGMAILTLVLISTEITAHALTRNPFLLAIIGAGLANVAVQTTFPYLSLLYLLQIWVAILFLWLIQHVPVIPDSRPSITK